MLTNFCFSEILLVAAANRFKVLKIFSYSYIKVANIFKYSYIKLQHIYRTVDYGLRKPYMSRVSNGNLIVLKWQYIHMISNIK